MSKAVGYLLFLVCAVGACAGGNRPAPAPAPALAPNCESHLDAGDVFTGHAVDGVFVLRDEETGCVQTTDAAMADTAFRPQSTFKIANALIGLETGVIEGQDHAWAWDGTPQALAGWEQDLDLGGALRESCVPCFQDVARRVGGERMERALAAYRYGNGDVSGAIDQFWLDGPLRITPREQTAFIHRMLAGELPVNHEHVELVWRLLEVEAGAGFSYRGKTGLGSMEGAPIGWFVGYLQRDGHRWVFATFVRGRSHVDASEEMDRLVPLRGRITRALLARAGVWAESVLSPGPRGTR